MRTLRSRSAISVSLTNQMTMSNALRLDGACLLQTKLMASCQQCHAVAMTGNASSAARFQSMAEQLSLQHHIPINLAA